MLNALHGSYSSVWGFRSVCSSTTAGSKLFHGCFFLTWSPVFCVLSRFYNNLLDPLRPRRGDILQASRYLVLTHHGHALLPMCPSTICSCSHPCGCFLESHQSLILTASPPCMLTVEDNEEVTREVACVMFPLLSSPCLCTASALGWFLNGQPIISEDELAPPTLLERQGL